MNCSVPIVYIYTRKSTNLQDHSLETQRQRIDAFCDAKQWKQRFYYEDTGSGTTLERPQFQRLMAEIKNHSYLVVYSLSRISRSVKQCHLIFEQLEKKYCKVISLSENIDTTTSIGKFNTTVLMGIAELEVNILRDRITDAMVSLIQQKKLRRKPQYGYKFISKNLPFVEDATEQAIIKRVVELYKTKTIAQICRELNAEGVKLRHSKCIYPQSIALILRNNSDVNKPTF